MAEYNIGAVARLTGISTHNLRAWEKRYQLQLGERSEGGRRVYNEADVSRLRLIKQCTDMGHSISKLAALSADELKSNLAQLAQAGRSSEASAPEHYQLAIASTCRYPFDEENLAGHHLQLIKKTTTLHNLLNTKEALDLVVVESPMVTQELMDDFIQLTAKKTPRFVLFIYRIARQEELLRIRQLGIRTQHAPVELAELEEILFRFVDRLRVSDVPERQNLLADSTPVERMFSDEQLDALQEQPYRLQCECPRHITDIIRSMEAFEMYSLQCQNRSDKDAALHAKLFRQTSIARSLMEAMLEEVLEHEGIKM